MTVEQKGNFLLFNDRHKSEQKPSSLNLPAQMLEENLTNSICSTAWLMSSHLQSIAVVLVFVSKCMLIFCNNKLLAFTISAHIRPLLIMRMRFSQDGFVTSAEDALL